MSQDTASLQQPQLGQVIKTEEFIQKTAVFIIDSPDITGSERPSYGISAEKPSYKKEIAIERLYGSPEEGSKLIPAIKIKEASKYITQALSDTDQVIRGEAMEHLLAELITISELESASKYFDTMITSLIIGLYEQTGQEYTDRHLLTLSRVFEKLISRPALSSEDYFICIEDLSAANFNLAGPLSTLPAGDWTQPEREKES